MQERHSPCLSRLCSACGGITRRVSTDMVRGGKPSEDLLSLSRTQRLGPRCAAGNPDWPTPCSSGQCPAPPPIFRPLPRRWKPRAAMTITIAASRPRAWRPGSMRWHGSVYLTTGSCIIVKPERAGCLSGRPRQMVATFLPSTPSEGQVGPHRRKRLRQRPVSASITHETPASCILRTGPVLVPVMRLAAVPVNSMQEGHKSNSSQCNTCNTTLRNVTLKQVRGKKFPEDLPLPSWNQGLGSRRAARGWFCPR